MTTPRIVFVETPLGSAATPRLVRIDPPPPASSEPGQVLSPSTWPPWL
jgi:hypothetical protein